MSNHVRLMDQVRGLPWAILWPSFKNPWHATRTRPSALLHALAPPFSWVAAFDLVVIM